MRHWPHHSLDDGPCQLVVTSPDHRIRIGWYGDDFDLWKITAAEDAASSAQWMATFNHNMPPEIAAGLTVALARDWDPDRPRFLAQPSMYWADSVEPLLKAGWEPRAAEHGTVEILAPDRQAGALIDAPSHGREDETVILWAGPSGWSTRAEATFTAEVPDHPIAATAAALCDPAPVVREGHMLHRAIECLVQLAPVAAETRPVSRAPTPLDVKRAAVNRAAHDQHGTARAHAARIRTSNAPRTASTPHVRAGTTDAPARTASRPRR